MSNMTPPPYNGPTPSPTWYQAAWLADYQSVSAPAPEPERSGRGPRSRWLVGIGATTIMGVLGLGTASIVFGDDGASSPEEAVQELARAVDSEDLIAAMSTIAPDEARSLPELFQASNKKLAGLASAGGDTSADSKQSDEKLGGIQLGVKDLDVTTTQLSDDIAKVELTGGTFSWDIPEGSSLDTSLNGFGAGFFGVGVGSDYGDEGLISEDMFDEDSFDQDMIDEQLEDSFPKRKGSFDIAKADGNAYAMAVKRDGGWFVSPMFTIAEQIRDDDDKKIDYKSEDPGPAADSPLGALTQLVDGMESRSITEATNALSSELSVWRVYREAGNYQDDLDEEITALSINGVKAHTEPIDEGRVRVVIDAAHIEATVMEPDFSTFDDEGFSTDFESTDEFNLPMVQHEYDVSYADGCFEVVDNGEATESECLDETGGGVAKALGVDRISVVAVTDRGGWAISPIESIADYLRTVVDHLDAPLWNRLTGGFWLGGTDMDERETTTAPLKEGDNEVALDSAGTAVTELTVPKGALALVTSPDDSVQVRSGDYTQVATVGAHRYTVIGDIGDSSAAVEVRFMRPDRSEKVDLSRGPVKGTVDADDPVVLTMTVGQLESSTVEWGDNVEIMTFTADGEEYLGVDIAGGFDDGYDEESDSTQRDPDELVTMIVARYAFFDDSESGTDENWYSISPPPVGGGFYGDDPRRETFELSEYYGESRISLNAGTSYELSAKATIAVEVSIDCPDISDSVLSETLDAGKAYTFDLEVDPAQTCDIGVYPLGDFDAADPDAFDELINGKLTMTLVVKP